jgi:protease-4
MIKFIKQIILNVISIILTMIIVPIIVLAIVAFVGSKSNKKILNNSVLTIDLQGEIVEKPLSYFEELWSHERDARSKICLWEIIEAINHARTDNRISSIYILLGTTKIGWAQIEEIRSALENFKKSGKTILAYSDSYTHKTYMLSTVADHIILHPEGDFTLQGLSIVTTFYKPFLDKLEIHPQVFRVGQYKSAVEPFICTQMSKESREQLDLLLNNIYSTFLKTVSGYLNTTTSVVNNMAETLSVTSPQKAKDLKLVTQLGYNYDVDYMLKVLLHIPDSESVNYVDLISYNTQTKKSKKDNKIAVLIAEGEITLGHSTSNSIGSESFVRMIRKVKNDDSVKAVILRINSPGGSALASNTIWKELKELQKKKPLVASMSNVAASGGYYIATACEQIVGYPTTITGSIGAFGLFFDTHLLLKNKLGIVTDVAKTNSYADLFSNIGRPLTDYEKGIIQKNLEKVYDTFLLIVSEGRKLKIEDVQKISSGRVWSGSMALEHKLLDELGTFSSAVAIAASLAKLEVEDCQIIYCPKKSITDWDQNLYDVKFVIHIMKNLTDQKELINAICTQPIMNIQGIQSKMPYALSID